MTDDESVGGTPPCLDPILVDGHPVDPDTARDVARFRRSERSRLLAARALSSEDRAQATAALIEALDRIIVAEAGTKIAVYWPIRGEPDLRPWMTAAHDAGAQILLPVVVEKQAPLEFHAWSPGCRMIRGFWNILVPDEGHAMLPDIVISPLVGVDRDMYRLGNGGGYYDRTLARLEPRPRIVGVGLAGCLLPTIFPMPWDVPMDEVILSDGTTLPG